MATEAGVFSPRYELTLGLRARALVTVSVTTSLLPAEKERIRGTRFRLSAVAVSSRSPILAEAARAMCVLYVPDRPD